MEYCLFARSLLYFMRRIDITQTLYNPTLVVKSQSPRHYGQVSIRGIVSWLSPAPSMSDNKVKHEISKYANLMKVLKHATYCLWDFCAG